MQASQVLREQGSEAGATVGRCPQTLNVICCWNVSGRLPTPRNGWIFRQLVPLSIWWNLKNYMNVFMKKMWEQVEIRQSCLGFNQEIMSLPQSQDTDPSLNKLSFGIPRVMSGPSLASEGRRRLWPSCLEIFSPSSFTLYDRGIFSVQTHRYFLEENKAHLVIVDSSPCRKAAMTVQVCDWSPE